MLQSFVQGAASQPNDTNGKVSSVSYTNMVTQVCENDKRDTLKALPAAHETGQRLPSDHATQKDHRDLKKYGDINTLEGHAQKCKNTITNVKKKNHVYRADAHLW